MKNKGMLVVLSGPSGSGKDTVLIEFLQNNPQIKKSISMTTRQARDGEIDGKDYYFVSDEEFDKNIESGNLLEWAEFVGNRYGTPKDKVEKMREEGKNVLLEIDVKGTKEVLFLIHNKIILNHCL